MNGTASLLRELEESISLGSDQSRLRALWHATDVLIAGQYSEEDIWVFGEVIERLARELEVAARAELARRLANTRNAPINYVCKLAYDSSIEVAGPVLRGSERLDVRTLVSIASSESQQHLLAISNRKSVTEPVTDVLVVVGNQEVINSLVRNAGARFSHFGFLKLIKRTEHDSILVETLGTRADIPRHIFQQLIAKASDEVRRRLERERPEMATEVQTLVADVTGELHSIFGPASKEFFHAKNTVLTLQRRGQLQEKKIFEFAQAHKLPEVTIGLSLLCALPANVVERGLTDPTGEMPMIFAKALDFSWKTTMSLLFLGAPDYKISAGDLDEFETRFSRLTAETARSVIKLYQSRKAPAQMS
jgi:uncharacterized protein (DUF2336 family)